MDRNEGIQTFYNNNKRILQCFTVNKREAESTVKQLEVYTDIQTAACASFPACTICWPHTKETGASRCCWCGCKMVQLL